VSKIEGKTTFSRHLKQFDDLTWLTLTPTFYDRSTPLISGCAHSLSFYSGINGRKRQREVRARAVTLVNPVY